jgi:transcriptional regulator with GAF, ATPase, and Fis domain
VPRSPHASGPDEGAQIGLARSTSSRHDAGPPGALHDAASALEAARYAHALGALESLEFPAARADGWHADALALRAEALAGLGRWSDATADAEAALAAKGSGGASARAARALGRVAAGRLDTDAALRRFDEALSHLRDAPDGAAAAAASLDAAEALLDRDGPVDASAATARIAEARDHVEGSGARSLRPRLALLLGRARAAAGDTEGAIEQLEGHLADAQARGARELEWQLHAALARTHELRGARVPARRSWERALEVLESVATALPPEHREPFWRDPRREQARKRAAGEVVAGNPSESAGPAPSHDNPLPGGRLARLIEILNRLASEHDIDRLLERITDCAIELSGAERGFVLLATGDHGDMQARTVRDVSSPNDPRVAFSRSIAEAVLIDGEPIVTVDARSDRRLDGYLSVHNLLLKSVACLPIRGRSGTVGVLYLEHRTRSARFAESQLDLLLAFADQAAIALENARLVASLARRTQELEDANSRLELANTEIERLLDAKTAELADARAELSSARDALRRSSDRSGIVGRSEAMRRVFAVVDRVRDADVPVVLQGESGTGKELVARAIHFSGARAQAPFVALNCAALPEALLESELFGHVRGAFTGADRDRTGLIARASGGTLFLDEIGDMPPKMQVDLLRVLQDRRVRPVGAERETEVDVRVISASHASLRTLVERGSFREDLYYRLNVVEIAIPPLRARRGDVPLLCEHFLAKFAERDQRPVKRLHRDAMAELVSHPFPGNVRQLEHVLLNAWVMGEGDVIHVTDLMLGREAAPSFIGEADPSPPADPVETSTRPPPSNLVEHRDDEKRRILEALASHGWNRGQAAAAIGMPRRTFYRRLKDYGIL